MKFTVCLAALCCIMLVLSDQFQGSTAIRKKKIFKKLKEFLPLLLALKGKKKIPLLIPIPIPIKVQAKKQSWPTAPAWPAASLPAFSWPSSLPESISYLPEFNSWSPQQPYAPQTVKTTHSYLPADYISDPSVKQGAKNEILTSYVVNNGAGLDYALNTQQKGGSNLYNNIYNSQAVSSTYNGDSYLNTNIENRRPILQKINKPIKKPLFGQPISNSVDDYENGKGSAPIYNDEGAKVAARSPPTSYSDSPVSNNNKVQFQTTSVNSDYNDASSYADNANTINSNNEYKIQNEISNEDNRLKSVSSDYLGDNNQVDNYEKSNELDENVKDQPTYYSNSVPAIRLDGYKKAKV